MSGISHRQETTDICLVNMPYGFIQWPALSVGLLHAILERDGVKVSSVFANLLFAEEIGASAYADMLVTNASSLLAEWTFAHVAFPGTSATPDEFATRYRMGNLSSHCISRDELADRLSLIREHAHRFTIRLAERILAGNPHIVGCSASFLQHVPSLALLRTIRDLAPHVVTILGGPVCETIMGLTTHRLCPWVDYVVSGEADNFIGDLVRSIVTHGRKIPADRLPCAVFGPAHRSGVYPTDSSAGYDGIPRAVTDSLEHLPAPNYDAYFAQLDECPTVKNQVEVSLLLESSRGCWWGAKRACFFCGLGKKPMRYRSKSWVKVGQELKLLSRKYGVSQFVCVDNVIDGQRLDSVVSDLKRPDRSYRLFYEARAGLTRRQVQDLSEAGVEKFQIGIESLHSKALKVMNKGTRAWQNIQALKWSRQFGIRVVWSIMHDLPGDDDAWYAEMAQLVPYLTHLQPPLGIAPLQYYRYSGYHERPEEWGVALQFCDQYRDVYPWGDEDLNDVAYFFYNRSDERLRKNPFLLVLTGEPDGMTALRREAGKWQEAFQNGSGAHLVMSSDGERLIVDDTRPAVGSCRHEFRGLAKHVLEACDEAPKVTDLFQRFSFHPSRRDEIERIVKDLTGRMLVLPVDGRLVGLSLRSPVPDLYIPKTLSGGLRFRNAGLFELEQREFSSADYAGARR